MSAPGVDHPQQDSEAEVTTLRRNVSVTARVEVAEPGRLLVRPSAGEFVEQAVVEVGEDVSVFWHGAEGGRMMPATVTTVERGAVPRWHLEVTGPAEEGQRRQAVRARVVLPLAATLRGAELPGETVDLCEAGARAVLEGWGAEPQPGETLDVVLELEDGPLVTAATVARQQARGSRWTMSLHFPELTEKEQDRLRRRVFLALREERARTAV